MPTVNQKPNSTLTSGSTFADYQRQLEADKSARLAARNHDLETENADLRRRVALLTSLDGITLRPPKWALPFRKKGELHHAIPTLMLSDWHFDEVVNADEMGGVNEYNREIAVERFKYVMKGAISETRKRPDLKYDGIYLIFNGDMFSGNIHDELRRTNEDTILGSIDFWADHVIAFIAGIKEEFGTVHVVFEYGNHGRNREKPHFKQAARDNFDWLLGRIVARYFRDNSNITFQIPESMDCLVEIYSTRYLVTHGDAFSGGSGISGMLAPLMLGNARTAIQGMALGEPHDWMCLGHFHTYWSGLGVIVNGSGKGYDEYARRKKFRPERPQQAMWITVPENVGPTYPQAIFATKEWLKK